jgi:HlyD family secretion protein
MPESNLSDIREEVLSEEVQDILTYRPKWIIRNGNILLLVIVLLMLATTWLIRYPDIITSSARLKALNPPKQIVARTNGKLIKLFVQNGETTQQDSHLGLLESTADYGQMMKLLQWVDSMVAKLEAGEIGKAIELPVPMLSALGEVQVQYQTFQNQLSLARQTIRSGYYEKKKAALKVDLQYMASLNKNVADMKELQEQDRALQEKELEAYEKLAKEKVIAPLELNQYRSRLLAKDQGLEQTSSQVINGDISTHRKQTELLDIQKQILDQQQQFQSSLLELKSQIEKWVQQYVLVAPEDGAVLFVSTLNQNEPVQNGQPLFYIQPEKSDFYVELIVGQKGFGKVKKGQKVILRVDGFPSDEFGYLSANIDYLATIPTRSDSFLVKAQLEDVLYTNYGKKLLFNDNMTAQAEIITDNRRLFERFFSSFRSLSRN